MGVHNDMTRINKQQADAIAEALLAPRRAELETTRTDREQQRAQARVLHQKKRRIAALALIAGAVGIVIAPYTGQAWIQGFIYGALAGAGIGWLCCAWWPAVSK